MGNVCSRISWVTLTHNHVLKPLFFIGIYKHRFVFFLFKTVFIKTGNMTVTHRISLLFPDQVVQDKSKHIFFSPFIIKTSTINNLKILIARSLFLQSNALESDGANLKQLLVASKFL